MTATFSYAGHELDGSGTLTCRYQLDGRPFVERVELGDGDWGTPWAGEAARLVHLVAGVSYYKTRAPGIVELDTPVRAAELAMLRDLYRRGLGEFAFRNRLDLSGIEFRAEVRDGPPIPYAPEGGRALIPFGGGVDSIVTVEAVKRTHPDSSLFVVSAPAQPFAAIERVVPLTGLPVVRVTRHLDPQVLKPATETGFLQGHVPITGILTAIGVLAAVGLGFEALVMSNEWSASDGNLTVDGQVVNHQFSKSREFETAFAAAVGAALGSRPSVFSLLRPYTEVWVAERFSRLGEYHRAFHSCNRAFAVDPARRLDRWCGECDKCCFIDLVLSPFLSKVELEGIFDGREPLGRPDLFERFAVLVGLSPDPKPFECVGEVGECRAAATLAAERGDRRDDALLRRLAEALPPVGPAEVAALLAPHDPHDIPDDFATQDLLV
ncbi:MAG: endonuclease domain-containing protein [Acidimicrobiales bacterium]